MPIKNSQSQSSRHQIACFSDLKSKYIKFSWKYLAILFGKSKQ